MPKLDLSCATIWEMMGSKCPPPPPPFGLTYYDKLLGRPTVNPIQSGLFFLASINFSWGRKGHTFVSLLPFVKL